MDITRTVGGDGWRLNLNDIPVGKEGADLPQQSVPGNQDLPRNGGAPVAQFLTRFWYSPVRVSTFSRSSISTIA